MEEPSQRIEMSCSHVSEIKRIIGVCFEAARALCIVSDGVAIERK